MLTQNVPYEPVWGDDGRRFFIDRFGFGVFRRRSCTSIHGCCGRTNHRTQASGSVISRRNSRNSARGTFRDLDSRPESWRSILSEARRRTVLVYGYQARRREHWESKARTHQR